MCPLSSDGPRRIFRVLLPELGAACSKKQAPGIAHPTEPGPLRPDMPFQPPLSRLVRRTNTDAGPASCGILAASAVGTRVCGCFPPVSVEEGLPPPHAPPQGQGGCWEPQEHPPWTVGLLEKPLSARPPRGGQRTPWEPHPSYLGLGAMAKGVWSSGQQAHRPLRGCSGGSWWDLSPQEGGGNWAVGGQAMRPTAC